MASLREFLKEQAGKVWIQEPETAKKRNSRVAAVSRLCSQIRGWLSQAESRRGRFSGNKRVVAVRSARRESAPPVSGLSISLGPGHVDVVPVARNVVGPLVYHGHYLRAPCLRPSRPQQWTREVHAVLGLEREPENRWSIVGQDRPQLERLDQSTLEAAFQSLLE